jgi:hypothetical protein
MVMMSMYGHRVKDEDDPYVNLAIEFMDASTDAITGRWLVDFFPIGSRFQLLQLPLTHRHSSQISPLHGVP